MVASDQAVMFGKMGKGAWGSYQNSLYEGKKKGVSKRANSSFLFLKFCEKIESRLLLITI